MDRKIVLLVLVALVLVSGFIIGNQTPEQQLKSAFEKSESSNYHITYDFTVGSSGLGSFISGMIDDPEVYRHNGNEKMVSSASILGTSTVVAFFEYENTSIECSETQSSLFNTSRQLNCELGSTPDYQPSEFGEYAEEEDVNITTDGTMTIAGRECDRFVMHIPPSEPDSDQGEQRMVLCMDQEKGYPALIKISKVSEYQLKDDVEENILTMRVKSYSGNVSSSDVTPPVDFVAGVTCEPDISVKAHSLDYSGNITVSVDGENRTSSINRGETRTINLSSGGQDSGWTTVKVYTEDGLSTRSGCSSYRSSYDDYDRWDGLAGN